MKKAPEHIAARSISLTSQNLDKRRAKRINHLLITGMRGLQLQYHEKSLKPKKRKNSL